MDKLPPLRWETETSNSNHGGNCEFNSILLLNEIVLEDWIVKVHGTEEDVSKGKDNKKDVDLVHWLEIEIMTKTKTDRRANYLGSTSTKKQTNKKKAKIISRCSIWQREMEVINKYLGSRVAFIIKP